MNLPVTSTQASALSDGSLGVAGQSLRKAMECKYPIDVISDCLLTVRLIERGGRECGLLIYRCQLA